MKWSVVILAAGAGKRMRTSIPKPLHQVAGKSMLTHVIDAVRRSSDADVTVVVQPDQVDSPEFRSAVDDGTSFVGQEKQLGTADALSSAGEAVLSGDRVLVLYADTPLIEPETIANLIQASESKEVAIAFVTADPSPVGGLGRIVRDASGAVARIVEEADADESTLAITEVNSGWYAFSGDFLRANLGNVQPAPNSELYLTDLIELAIDANRSVVTVPARTSVEIIGVNTREQLAFAEAELQARYRKHWMSNGVTLVDPASTYFGSDVAIEMDVVIHPNTHIKGESVLRQGCDIGPNSIVDSSEIGRSSRFVSSYADHARVGANCEVGPFSRLRPGAVLSDGVHVGNYAEIKQSSVGSGTKIGHFSYVGDSTIGVNVNIGAGTVFVNYDGDKKNHTRVGDDVFIGSGSMLVAPLEIGDGALTGAGAVVTKNVEPGTTVFGVPARKQAGRGSSDRTSARLEDTSHGGESHE
jgi:bifunctional UDP-N-acetylglucosamine pyrophosphorylase/glucosamine-1-phosphate N-acetyltransferase